MEATKKAKTQYKPHSGVVDLLLTIITAIKYILNIIKPKNPTDSPKIYVERPKKAQITVNIMKTGTLFNPREALVKARVAINNPIIARGTTFLSGKEISIIIVARRVMDIIAPIPLSQPKNLAIKAAKTIKSTDLTACAQWGLPVGLESTLNLSKKFFCCMNTPLNLRI